MCGYHCNTFKKYTVIFKYLHNYLTLVFLLSLAISELILTNRVRGNTTEDPNEMEIDHAKLAKISHTRTNVGLHLPFSKLTFNWLNRSLFLWKRTTIVFSTGIYTASAAADNYLFFARRCIVVTFFIHSNTFALLHEHVKMNIQASI